MKFMMSWKPMPGTLKEAIERFLTGLGQPPEGVVLLGRWHKVDWTGGFSLCETTNLSALFDTVAVWADVLDVEITPVLEDAEAGPIYVKTFKKT